MALFIYGGPNVYNQRYFAGLPLRVLIGFGKSDKPDIEYRVFDDEQIIEGFKAFRTPDVGWDLIVNKNIFLEQILPACVKRKLSDKEVEAYHPHGIGQAIAEWYKAQSASTLGL